MILYYIIYYIIPGAFANIRRRDATPSAHEQFRKELTQTNEIIKVYYRYIFFKHYL